MDIEKLYEETKKKMSQYSNLEENKFMEMLKKQDNLFLTTLQELIAYYPHNKVSDTTATNSKYNTLLSALNGTSNQIKTIQNSINDKVQMYDVKMEHDEDEIDNLKKMYENLSTYSDLEHLDASSKRMLNDYINVYSTQCILFWIKLIVVVLFIGALFYEKQIAYFGIWVLLVFILYILAYIKGKMDSYVKMPTSMVAGTETVSTTPLTCTDSEYGCCPDGVTTSIKNHLNCGCAKSEFGCCPNGTNKSSADSKCDIDKNCADTHYGCCTDGITISNRSGSNCTASAVKPNSCSTTEYGCCPDGITVSTSDGSNCLKGCANSKYGCCPNGVTISNADRSNCNMASCAGTPFGCCPNGLASNRDRTNCR
jgi:hypothetical protein